MTLYVVLGVALMGLFVTGCLVWDIRREYRRDYGPPPSVRIDHEWMTEQRQHDRLQAVSDPFLYGQRKGAKADFQRGNR